MTRAGRKNLKKASEEDGVSLQQGQGIMQVVSLRGSNVIEVMDTKGVKSLALFPAKFQKSFWIKRGSFVLVDETGREKALESGSKITCIVSRVLFHDQVRRLEKSSEWPSIFRDTVVDDLQTHGEHPASESREELDSDEDGLAPLEANSNRNRPVEVYTDSDTGSDSDSDS